MAWPSSNGGAILRTAVENGFAETLGNDAEQS